MRICHMVTERVCLLYPAGARRVNNGTMAIALDGQRLDDWRSVVWDPDIVSSQGLSVCYDCLCLMALYRDVMLLAHGWAEWSVWTGTASGYCRTITWEVGYLPRLHPPCDVDRSCDYMTWQIKGPVVVRMSDSPVVRSYARDFAGGPFRGKDSDHGDWSDRLWGQSCRLL